MKIKKWQILISLFLVFSPMIFLPANAERKTLTRIIQSLLKRRDVIPIEIVNELGAPIEILSIKAKDKGTKILQIQDIELAFSCKIKNISEKNILSAQLFLVRNLPFEYYEARSYQINSPRPLKRRKKQKVKFRLAKYFRTDAYYSIWISKVIFDDNSVWETEIDHSPISRWDAILKEIQGEDAELDEIKNLKDIQAVEKIKEEETIKQKGGVIEIDAE